MVCSHFIIAIYRKKIHGTHACLNIVRTKKMIKIKYYPNKTTIVVFDTIFAAFPVIISRMSISQCLTALHFYQTDIEMIAFRTLIVDLNHLDLGVHSEVYLPYRKIKSCKNLNKRRRVVLFPSNGHRFCLWSDVQSTVRSQSLTLDRYSFSTLLQVGGWIGLGGYLHTKTAYPPTVTHLTRLGTM